MSEEGDEQNNTNINNLESDGYADASGQGRRRQTSYNSMIRRWDREGDKVTTNHPSRLAQECRFED